jgi:RsiW-degrading membrane proteinase PrsW (M82 family)
MLAGLLFAAPLEEGAKLLLLRRYARRQQRTAPRATFLMLAVWISVGFAIVEAVYGVAWGQAAESGLRPVLLCLAHLFFAGLWAVAVGDYFRLWGMVWLLATVFHALFEHLVNTSVGRGWWLLLPVFASVIGVTWLGLRNLRQRPFLAIDSGPAKSRAFRFLVNDEHESAPLHWVLGGAFVTTGVVLASLAAAIYAGHTLGLDFALADEADGRADGPIVLLAMGLVIAFPFSGYLIARASGTTSVIEPAMGAALAIVVVVALLSVTAPVAVIFALAVAPLAFGLACAGAWFGVR